MIDVRDESLAEYEALLMEYAAGALDAAQSMIITAHMAFKPQVRHIVRRYETLGGYLIESLCEPAPMKPCSLGRVLDRIEQESSPARPSPESGEAAPDLPPVVRECLCPEKARALQWQKMKRGMACLDIPVSCESSRARMLNLEPGATAPRQTRHGLEIILVVRGALVEDHVTYRHGDLIVREGRKENTHRPASCREEGGICLTVTSGPSSPFSPLDRLMEILFR